MIKSKMNETGVAVAAASDGGSDGFKMETVVQQCVEVDICIYVISVIYNVFLDISNNIFLV